jgi:hypothetical protein
MIILSIESRGFVTPSEVMLAPEHFKINCSAKDEF